MTRGSLFEERAPGGLKRTHRGRRRRWGRAFKLVGEHEGTCLAEPTRPERAAIGPVPATARNFRRGTRDSATTLGMAFGPKMRHDGLTCIIVRTCPYGVREPGPQSDGEVTHGIADCNGTQEGGSAISRCKGPRPGTQVPVRRGV